MNEIILDMLNIPFIFQNFCFTAASIVFSLCFFGWLRYREARRGPALHLVTMLNLLDAIESNDLPAAKKHLDTMARTMGHNSLKDLCKEATK